MYEVRHRVLRERLEQTVVTADRGPDGECVRLALLCLSLLERHQLTGKGRCRYCRPQRDWRWRQGSPVHSDLGLEFLSGAATRVSEPLMMNATKVNPCTNS